MWQQTCGWKCDIVPVECNRYMTVSHQYISHIDRFCGCGDSRKYFVFFLESSRNTNEYLIFLGPLTLSRLHLVNLSTQNNPMDSLKISMPLLPSNFSQVQLSHIRFLIFFNSSGLRHILCLLSWNVSGWTRRQSDPSVHSFLNCSDIILIQDACVLENIPLKIFFFFNNCQK